MIRLLIIVCLLTSRLSAAGAPEGDPEFRDEWWVKELRVTEAWERASGHGVVIADCDSGYFVDERDLKNQLLMQFARDFSDPKHADLVSDGPFAYHGTAVATLMSGARDGNGTNGIAFDARVVPLQSFNYDESLDHLELEDAVSSCVRAAAVIPGVQILVVESHSETGTVERLSKVRTAIANAVKAGVVVVIPAGNKPPSADAASELDLEKKFDTGSIIVGAVGADGKKLASSNFGDRVTVAAFGEKVRTLIGRGGQMGNFGGTSAATPQVAATVALMLEVHPELSPRQVRSILSDTARIRAGSKTVGGVLDVFAAVNRAATRKRH